MTAPALSVSTPYGRHYINPNRPWQAPSITNIKSVKGIDGLKYWAARQAGEYTANNIQKLSALTHDEIVTLVRQSPFRPDGDQAESSDVGDVVHDWIDGYIKGQPPTQYDLEHPAKKMPDGQQLLLTNRGANTARKMWESFGAVLVRYQPRFIDSEFTVWSDTYGYAGTADWAAKIGYDIVLGDTKTGKNIYPDMRYQLAALAHADYIIEPDGKQRQLPKFNKYAILHVRPTFAELVPYNTEAVDEAFQSFLAMKVIFDDDIKWKDKTVEFAPKVYPPRAALWLRQRMLLPVRIRLKLLSMLKMVLLSCEVRTGIWIGGNRTYSRRH